MTNNGDYAKPIFQGALTKHRDVSQRIMVFRINEQRVLCTHRPTAFLFFVFCHTIYWLPKGQRRYDEAGHGSSRVWCLDCNPCEDSAAEFPRLRSHNADVTPLVGPEHGVASRETTTDRLRQAARPLWRGLHQSGGAPSRTSLPSCAEPLAW